VFFGFMFVCSLLQASYSGAARYRPGSDPEARYCSRLRTCARRRSKQVTPSKNATGRRADGRTDDGTLQAGIVAVASVAFNRGAQVSTGEEPACGSNERSEDLSPETSFRPRVPEVLRPQHLSRIAAGRKSRGRQPGLALLDPVRRLGQREQKRTGCPRGVVTAGPFLGVGPRRREGGPQRKRNDGWVSKPMHPASFPSTSRRTSRAAGDRCIDRADNRLSAQLVRIHEIRFEC
jgi:hypothetical protein